jgi:hypothetical protein
MIFDPPDALVAGLSYIDLFYQCEALTDHCSASMDTPVSWQQERALGLSSLPGDRHTFAEPKDCEPRKKKDYI